MYNDELTEESKMTEQQITMEDLKASMCRWPIGDPQDKDFHFCGEKRVSSDESYCQHHTEKAYRSSTPRSADKK